MRRLIPLLPHEQIAQARSIDVLSYLQMYEPHNVRSSGPGEHRLIDHDSFVVSNNMWYWWSQGFGGKSALDYLVKVRNMGFIAAVQSLTGGKIPVYDKEISPKMNSPPGKKGKNTPFRLPKANLNNDQVIAYLRGRGISKRIIKRCIDAGVLYESSKHRCVFVGKDGGTPKFACERGIAERWMKDMPGSRKQFSFSIPPETDTPESASNLAVFESPIDAMAHYTVHELGHTGWDGHRLSLGGVSTQALTSFLKRNPAVNYVLICLDNDKAGIQCTSRIIKLLKSDKRFAHIKLIIAPPPIGKDYADTLQAVKKLNQEKSHPYRQKADFSI